MDDRFVDRLLVAEGRAWRAQFMVGLSDLLPTPNADSESAEITLERFRHRRGWVFASSAVATVLLGMTVALMIGKGDQSGRDTGVHAGGSASCRGAFTVDSVERSTDADKSIDLNLVLRNNSKVACDLSTDGPTVALLGADQRVVGHAVSTRANLLMPSTLTIVPDDIVSLQLLWESSCPAADPGDYTIELDFPSAEGDFASIHIVTRIENVDPPPCNSSQDDRSLNLLVYPIIAPNAPVASQSGSFVPGLSVPPTR